MENEIQMIPVEKLRHHPQNPRHDLGDLNELADSISAQGILQNLTVIPDPEAEDRYLVVIGNRRFEAAKMAGLTELPCRVAHMDQREAMRTMMSENMQRTDLTMYDQIQGVGYMQQLGMTIPEIAKGTGLSEKTVRNRAKLGQLPADTLQSACSRGATLMDLLDVMEIKSESKRKEVMDAIGSNNYVWALNHARHEQAVREWHATVMPAILAKYPKIGEVPNGERYSGKWKELARWSNRDEKTAAVPDPKPGKKYALQDFDFMVCLMVEDEGWKRQKAAEKSRDAWMKDRKATAKALNAEAWELRADFIRKFTVKNAQEKARFYELLACAVMGWGAFRAGIGYYHSSWDQTAIRRILCIPYEQQRDKQEPLEHELQRRGVKREAFLLAWAVSGGVTNNVDREDGYISTYNAIWKECGELTDAYDLLKDLGYQMSDFEISLRDKTNDFFKEEYDG